jgi:integrase
MKRPTFDLKTLADLKPRAKRYEYRDPLTQGLVLRITPAGSKSFYWVRRDGPKVERVRLANLADVKVVEDVRQRARELNASLGRGEHPAEKLRALQNEMTFSELWAMYLSRHAQPNKRDWRQDEIRWGLHLRRALGSRPLSAIKRPDVVRLLERVKTNAGPTQANRVRALIHVMYEKAREWGLDLSNPVAGTARNPEHAKERYLAPKELRAFIQAARDEPDADVRDFLLLLLLTGVRGHSLRAARWADLNLRDGVWNIPPESMKAGRPLVLPLAPAVVALLKQRREVQPPSCKFVFPSPHAAEGYLHQIPRKGWLRVLTAAGLEGVTPKGKRRRDAVRRSVTPHTLRRCFATYAVGAGTPIEVIGRALGHTQPGGITAVYARVHPDLVRRAVEATVEAMLAIADSPEAQADVLTFPMPQVFLPGAVQL